MGTRKRWRTNWFRGGNYPLQESCGWSASAIAFFRKGLHGMPSDTLRMALATRNWETLQSILMHYQGTAARLAAAVGERRSGVMIDDTRPEEATFKRSVM